MPSTRQLPGIVYMGILICMYHSGLAMSLFIRLTRFTIPLSPQPVQLPLVLAIIIPILTHQKNSVI